MLPDVFGLRHDLQVIGMVVESVAVPMVNNFLRLQATPKFLLCKSPMLMPVSDLTIGFSPARCPHLLAACSSAFYAFADLMALI